MDKRLHIMRGIPGSGKSHRAMELAGGDPNNIFSADNHFMKDGVYTFDPDQLWPAHKNCRYHSTKAMRAGQPVVIIDNTNIRIKEMVDYAAEGWCNDYKVTLEEPTSPWWVEKVKPCLEDRENEFRIIRVADLLFEKNVHGVPLSVITDMIKKWQHCTMVDVYDRIFGPDHGLS